MKSTLKLLATSFLVSTQVLTPIAYAEGAGETLIKNLKQDARAQMLAQLEGAEKAIAGLTDEQANAQFERAVDANAARIVAESQTVIRQMSDDEARAVLDVVRTGALERLTPAQQRKATLVLQNPNLSVREKLDAFSQNLTIEKFSTQVKKLVSDVGGVRNYLQQAKQSTLSYSQEGAAIAGVILTGCLIAILVISIVALSGPGAPVLAIIGVSISGGLLFLGLVGAAAS